MDVHERAEVFRNQFDRLRSEVGKVIAGNETVINGVLTSLFAGGHCLLEGVPGLGKTMLVRTLSDALSLNFSRIQFTPDLMPADIIGTSIILESESGHREVEFRPGPVFANVILADEINRATPKTQSALLEAMQEHTVSVARTIHRLEEPFLVMATQNPIEMEGTYPLPEAQLDRFFFKLNVEFPTADVLSQIVDRTTQSTTATADAVMDAPEIVEWQAFVRDVASAPQVTNYASRLVLATHPETPDAPEMVKQFVRYGASPRGAQALLLAGKVAALRAGRFNVSFDDIKEAALPALRHRVMVNFEGEAEGVTPGEIVREVIDKSVTAADVA